MPPHPRPRSLLPAFALLLLLPLLATAATPRVVDSVAALQTALAEAAAGDAIVLENGVYELPATFAVTCAGRANQPITIAAKSVGGVTLRGPGGFALRKPAAYLVIRGFALSGAAGKSVIEGGVHHVRITRNTFACSGEGAYLTVSGDDVEVDHNEFRDKHTLGNMISVTGVGAQVARRLWIHHNHFHDFAAAHGNGAETIRFGLSTLSMSTGEGMVEHNRFERCTGENELISNKSCGNTYRYNTFLDSPGAQLTLRHGNDCRVYGNIFRGLDGLRIFGDRHLVFSNYFERNTRGINLGNGDGEVADGAKLTSHDRPDHCVIVFNTLVDNRDHLEMDRRAGGMGATHTVFAFNVIQGGGVAARLEGPHPDDDWQGNVVWRTRGTGDLPAAGLVAEDPRLTPDRDGILRPSPQSPLVGAAGASFAFVSVDLDGQPRPAAKSIGADEPASTAVASHLLRPEDVGPAAD